MTSRTPAALAITLLVAFVAASRPSAQAGAAGSQAETHAGKHPDWSGLYRFARGADLAGFKLVAPNLDEEVKAHLQPWARLKMLATNGVAEDRGAICQPDGLFRQFGGAAGFQWLPAGDKIVLPSTMLNVVGVRRIYLTDRHPAHLPSSWLGHSIGRWDDDETFVIDTIGFNDKSWLMSGMEPHTEELHVVERVRAVGDGSLLEFRTTVEDRKALTSPYSYTRYYKRSNGEFVEDVCNGEPGDARMWNEFRKRALANPPPPSGEK